MKAIDDFGGRVAVVTGAASGIGRGIAAHLAAAGATVVLADIDEAGASAVAREVGGHARGVDVTDPASMQALADGVLGSLGRVDILVNNAGVGPLSTFDDLTLADFGWVMDINVWGVVHGLKTFVPLLAANPDGGYIVNTASVAALTPLAGAAAYAASKAAVVAVSEAVAAEFAERGHIGISILLPALVRTNIIANASRRPGHHEGAPRTQDFLPPMRVLDPAEVGAMVVAAMRAGQRYIITHPEVAPVIRERCAALLQSCGGS